MYKALDPVLDRIVAIKIMPSKDYSDDQFRRFQKEASTASKLNYPGIVKALDFGIVWVLSYMDEWPDDASSR